MIFLARGGMLAGDGLSLQPESNISADDGWTVGELGPWASNLLLLSVR